MLVGFSTPIYWRRFVKDFVAFLIAAFVFGALYYGLGAPGAFAWVPFSKLLFAMLLGAYGSFAFVFGNWASKVLFLCGYTLIVLAGHAGVRSDSDEMFLFACGMPVFFFCLLATTEHRQNKATA